MLVLSIGGLKPCDDDQDRTGIYLWQLLRQLYDRLVQNVIRRVCFARVLLFRERVFTGIVSSPRSHVESVWGCE